jgi:hypothetical protein
LIVALGSLASFAVGGRYGFVVGYGLGSYTTEVEDSALVLASLKAQDNGNTEAARVPLEQALDGAVLEYGAFSGMRADRPFFAPDNHYLDLTCFMKRISEYRKLHPHEIEDAGVRHTVESTLARYAAPCHTPPGT